MNFAIYNVYNFWLEKLIIILKFIYNMTIDHKDEIKRGEALFEKGDLDQAESVFKSILQVDPADCVSLNNLGVINSAKGHTILAEEYFKKTIALKGDYLESTINLASLYQNAKRWNEASILLERYLDINDTNPDIYNQLGIVNLEMEEPAKACAVLERSLKLKPEQPAVKESLDAVKKEMSKHDTIAPLTLLNILFVQEAPCIRNYKMATALRSRGHNVSLAFTKALLSQVYKGLSDNVYNECIKLNNYRQLWDISRNYDIIHCHNEPDELTVSALAGEAPVVHDTHDLISLRANGDKNLSYFEGIANRGANGRIYSTPFQLEEARKLYGINGSSIVYYNYASNNDLPLTSLQKLSDQDGQVHIVYEGGIGGNGHRDFSSLFKELSDSGIHIHIYPTFYNQDIANGFSLHNNIHYYHPLSPKQIIENMTQYDFGIIPFNLEKGNKRFLDSTIANKLFEYLAAGLPVIASPLKTYIDFFRKNPVGITYNTTQDIIVDIPKLKEIASRTDFTKYIFTYEGEIERLEELYYKIIDSFYMSNDTKGIEKSREHSSTKCGNRVNINKHEPSTPYIHQQYTDTSSLSISTKIRLIIKDILPLLVNERHRATYHPEDIYMFFQNEIANGHTISQQNIDNTLNNALQHPIEVRKILSIEPFLYPGFISRLGSLTVKASPLPDFKNKDFDDILKHCLTWLADENITGFISNSWYKKRHQYPGKNREVQLLLQENTELASFWFNLWQKDPEQKMAEKCKQLIYSTIGFLNENISSLTSFLFTNMNKNVAGLNPQLLSFVSLTYRVSKQFDNEGLNVFQNNIHELLLNHLDQRLDVHNLSIKNKKAVLFCSLWGYNLSSLVNLSQTFENEQIVQKAKVLSSQYIEYCKGLIQYDNFKIPQNHHEIMSVFYYLKIIIGFEGNSRFIWSEHLSQLIETLITSINITGITSGRDGEGWSSLYGYQQIDILDTLLDWSIRNGKDK